MILGRLKSVKASPNSKRSVFTLKLSKEYHIENIPNMRIGQDRLGYIDVSDGC